MIKLFRTKGIIIFLVYLSLFIYFELPIIKLAKDSNSKLSIWLYPFIMQDSKILILVLCGYIFFICRLPYIYFQNYISTREYLKNTSLIIWYTFLYFLMLFIVTILPLLTIMTPTLEWGAVLSSIATNGYGEGIGYIFIDSNIMEQYSGIYATLFSFLLSVLSGLFVSLTIKALSVSKLKQLGVFISYWFIYLQYFITDFINEKALLFSPISWNSLICFSVNNVNSAAISLLLSVFIISLLAIICFLEIQEPCKKSLTHERSAENNIS